MTWTPRAGLVLKHNDVDRKIELVKQVEIAGMIFWEVSEDTHGVVKENSWLIHESCIVDGYTPKR